jgi:hypothetical protein
MMAEARLDIPALVHAGIDGAAEEVFDFPPGAGVFPVRSPRMRQSESR